MKKSAGKRVLMLLQNLSYPKDPRVRNEARTLATSGYQVSVIAPSQRGQRWHEKIEGVNVYRFPGPAQAKSSMGYFLEYGYSLMAIFIVSLFVFIRRGFDVIHIHQPPDILAFIAVFYKVFGKRFVMDHHDISPELYYARFRGKGNRFIFRVLLWLEKFSCRIADQIIATNQSYKQIEMQRDHVPEHRITIVRNGPDLNDLYKTTPFPELLNKQKIIIGYVGVTGIQDGLDYLLRSLQYLTYDLGKEDFICVVVGSGDALAGLKSFGKQFGIADKVLFTGWVSRPENVARYLSSMEICVSPEPSDPYNDRSTAVKLMEYMALGKPIVAFDLPEHQFTAQDAAVYARPNDERDFARQIALLMDDPLLRENMGQKGRERVERELSWQIQEKVLLKIYESIIPESRKGTRLEIGKWFAQRGLEFVRKRSAVLLSRYGISSSRAKNRIEKCVVNLARSGCSPTFLVPGTLVKRYSKFIRQLQDRGVEIGAHSHDHIDLKAFPPEVARKQLQRAAQTFAHYGIELHGFRCPYLSCTDKLCHELPHGIFSYSSNTAIQWDVVSGNDKDSKKVFEIIDKFYQPKNAKDYVCTPWTNSEMVEIPVCVPDDLQISDGLGLDSKGISEAWGQILDKIHKRGELFTLIFHTELSEYCNQGLNTLLSKARSLHPAVWISRLSEISDWWQEKSSFRTEIHNLLSGIRILFFCSSRATILAKGFCNLSGMEEWDGKYFRLNTRKLDVPLKPRPFVGVASSVSRDITSFLQNQGYILDTDETASQCSVFLNNPILDQFKTQLELINWIEKSEGPLVRYWRWPDGAKSALSITGDLDAFSLMDYFLRLLGR